MAPFRASRSTRSNHRTGNHVEADVFDGLPIRQWRLHESIVVPPPSLDQLQPGFGANSAARQGQAPQQPRSAKQHNKWTMELPKPKGSELYAPWCQQLLFAARAGRIRKRTDDDVGQQARDDEKENGDDSDTVQQNEVKGFMAKRWTQLSRQMEGPDIEYLAKRRKGLASVVPLPGMPGMVGNDGQGAAAEGAMGPPVVEERRRNMPPRRKPKKGIKKKKMSDGAGLGVSASAEALAASHAGESGGGLGGENGVSGKAEEEGDSTMQDADDGDEDGEEGETGDEEGDEDGESETLPDAGDESGSAPPPPTSAEPAPKQHPLANEITVSEIISEPIAEDPQAPPLARGELEAQTDSPVVLKHDLVPEATDEPLEDEVIPPGITNEAPETIATEPSAEVSEDNAMLDVVEAPISAAEVQEALVPEKTASIEPQETGEVQALVEDAVPEGPLELQAKEEDEAVHRDDAAQVVPPTDPPELIREQIQEPAEPILPSPEVPATLATPVAEPAVDTPLAEVLLDAPIVAPAPELVSTTAGIPGLSEPPPPLPQPVEPSAEAAGAEDAAEEAKAAVATEEGEQVADVGASIAEAGSARTEDGGA